MSYNCGVSFFSHFFNASYSTAVIKDKNHFFGMLHEFNKDWKEVLGIASSIFCQLCKGRTEVILVLCWLRAISRYW